MTFESLLRRSNRLWFVWSERKQMCKFYEILRETLDSKIERQDIKIAELEHLLAEYQRGNCER